ncbi:NTF2 fold immunity protein [Pseudomonas sp. GM84]|uniref:NTF2 fold immunity protein n=1 Tax=Pseudomonas sp. GM84 TaxID=1144340 RepID=UPI0012FAF311|nr:NTF2 fold immunity protein [Pseudomonas sp. GM84]
MEKFSVTDLSDECRDVLKGFMSEMYEWEVKYYKKSLDAFEDDSLESDLEVVMRDDLLKIFKTFVAEGGRNYDRVENLVCGRHPEYDLGSDQLEIEVVRDNHVLVVIKKTKGLAPVFRLTLAATDGKCMILSRELQGGNKWQKTYI